MITTFLAALALSAHVPSAPAPAELSPAAALPLTEMVSSAPAAQPQDDKEDPKDKPDSRDEIKAALKELKGHVGKRGDEDTQALAIIDTMLQEFPKSGPKDRKAIVKEIAACLKVTRKQTKEGLFDNKLHLAAAVALGNMGPESVKDLTKWADHKNFKKDKTTNRALIVALGKTKDEKVIKTLVGLLSNHEPEVQAASAEALGQFAHLEQKERKEIFKKMLDQLTAVKNALNVDTVDPIVRQRYDTIAGPMLTTLQVLSGEEIRDPLEFRTWWNKTGKKKDWDEGRDDGKDA